MIFFLTSWLNKILKDNFKCLKLILFYDEFLALKIISLCVFFYLLTIKQCALQMFFGTAANVWNIYKNHDNWRHVRITRICVQLLCGLDFNAYVIMCVPLRFKHKWIECIRLRRTSIKRERTVNNGNVYMCTLLPTCNSMQHTLHTYIYHKF